MNPHEPNADDPVGMLLQTPLPADEKPTSAHIACVQKLVSRRAMPARPVRVRWRREILSVAAIVLAVVGIVFLAPKNDEPTAAEEWLNTKAFTPAPDWIRAKIMDTEGSKLEMWMSPSLRVQVYVLKDGFRIDDAANAVQYIKRPRESSIYRMKMNTQGVEWYTDQFIKLQQFTTYPSAIVSDEVVKVLADEARRINIDGKEWIERKITFEDSGKRLEGTLQIDPSQGRVVKYVVDKFVTGKKVREKTYYEYPSSGPATLQALGIQQSANFIDGAPAATFQWRDVPKLFDVLNRAVKETLE